MLEKIKIYFMKIKKDRIKREKEEMKQKCWSTILEYVNKNECWTDVETLLDKYNNKYGCSSLMYNYLLGVSLHRNSYEGGYPLRINAMSIRYLRKAFKINPNYSHVYFYLNRAIEYNNKYAGTNIGTLGALINMSGYAKDGKFCIPGLNGECAMIDTKNLNK